MHKKLFMLSALLFACSSQTAAPVTAESGGAVTLGEEVSLSVPPRALPADTVIGITRLGEVPKGDTGAFLGFGQAFRMTPAGTQFDLAHPATLTVKLDYAALAARGLDPRSVVLHYLNERDGRYYAVPTQIDLDRQLAVSLLEHFTVYAPLAAATVAGDQPPLVALQGTVPATPRIGAPLLVRATVRDQQPGGALASVQVNVMSGGTLTALEMKRDPGAPDTYQAVLPGRMVGASTTYWVVAQDALLTQAQSNPVTATATASLSSGAACSPSPQTLSAGFSRLFTFTARDSSGSNFTVVPERIVASPPNVIDAPTSSGAVFHAARVGADQVVAAIGDLTALCIVTVLDGQLSHVIVTDGQGKDLPPTLTIHEGERVQFEARGEDDFGNHILVTPRWSLSTPATGALTADGVFYALDAPLSQTLSAQVGSAVGREQLSILPRLWSQPVDDQLDGGSFTDPELADSPGGAVLSYQRFDGSSGALHARTVATDPSTDTIVYPGYVNQQSLAGGPQPMIAWAEYFGAFGAAQLVNGSWNALPRPPLVDPHNGGWTVAAAQGGGRTWLATGEGNYFGTSGGIYLWELVAGAWVQATSTLDPNAAFTLAVRGDGTPFYLSTGPDNTVQVQHLAAGGLVSDGSAGPARQYDLVRAAFSQSGLLYLAFLTPQFDQQGKLGSYALVVERMRTSGIFETVGGGNVSTGFGEVHGFALTVDGETPWVFSENEGGANQVVHLGLDGQWHRKGGVFSGPPLNAGGGITLHGNTVLVSGAWTLSGQSALQLAQDQ